MPSPKTSSESSINVDYHSLKKAALVLRALNHKLRQQLLKLIEEEKKITVTEIYVRLRLEQSRRPDGSLRRPVRPLLPRPVVAVPAARAETLALGMDAMDPGGVDHPAGRDPEQRRIRAEGADVAAGRCELAHREQIAGDLHDLLLTDPQMVQWRVGRNLLLKNAQSGLAVRDSAGLQVVGNRLIDGAGVRVDSAVVSDKGLKLGAGTYVLQVGKRKFARVTLA